MSGWIVFFSLTFPSVLLIEIHHRSVEASRNEKRRAHDALMCATFGEFYTKKHSEPR